MLFMAYSPQQSCITGAATRGSIKRKAVGHHAADLCPATAGSRAGSVDSALIGSTARLVDAIAREYGVLVNRYESTKRRFSPQLDALNSARRVIESCSVRETASCPLTYRASAAISPPTDEVSYKWSQLAN